MYKGRAINSRRFLARWHALIGLLISTVCSSAPPNDLFSDRIHLVGLPVQASGSNVGAAKQTGEPNFFADSAGFSATYQPVWWTWTSPTNALVSVIVAMPERSPIIAVFAGNSLSSLLQVSKLISRPPFQPGTTNIYLSEAQFSAIAGVTYSIAVDSSSVTLAWDSSGNSQIAGYRLYSGPDSGAYNTSIAITSVRQDAMAALAPGLSYYFAVTDFDATGAESDLSNEVSLMVPQLPSQATRPFDLLVTAAPTVSFANPAQGTEFSPGADVSLQVTASAILGTRARVEYSFHAEYGDLLEIPLATATNSPFSFLWTNVSAGRYVLRATLIDDGGASSSSTVAITVAKPANDNFADRILLDGFPVSINGSTIAAGTQSGEPLSPEGLPALHTVWWDWVAPAGASNAVVVTMPNAPATLAVYTGTSSADLSDVTASLSQRSWQSNTVLYYTSETRFLATAGAHYIIRVDGPEQPLVLAITAPPAVTLINPLAGTEIATGSNFVLQVRATDFDGSVNAVEYSYTTEAGSTFPIGVATSAPFSFSWSNSLPRGRYLLTAAAIDDLGAQTISAEVPITVGRPANDDFAGRLPIIGLPVVITGSNIAATRKTGEPDFISDTYADNPVWFSWIAPTSGLSAVVVTMANVSPVVGVFIGESLSTLIQVSTLLDPRYTVSNEVYYFTVEARFNAIAGTEYTFAIGSDRPEGSRFSLAVTAPPQVEITIPSQAAEFRSGADVPVELAITDPDRTTVRVQIVAVNNDDPSMDISVVLSNAPFALMLQNLQPGHYLLTATAFDDVGASTVSAPIAFVVGRPPNDNFEDRLFLTGSPASTGGSTVAADREPDEPISLGGYYSSRTVWWAWSAPSGGPKAVLVTMANYQPVIGVFSGDSLSSLVEVSTLTTGASWHVDGTTYYTAQARFEASAGTLYSIAVDSISETGASFTLVVSASPEIAISNPPPGSNFDPGVPIPLEVATYDDDGAIDRVEYYVSQGGANSILLTTVAISPFSFLWTHASPGQYTISARAIDDSDITTLADPVNVTVGRPANDNFADRITLMGLPVITNGSTLAAGKEAGEPLEISDAPTTGTVWWTWSALTTGPATVVITAPNFKPLVAVFTGSTISNLTEISTLKLTATISSNGLFYYTREARFNATAGRVYAIAVDSLNQPFTLALTARPTVQITSPMAGTDFIPNSDILLQASAIDPDGKITRVFYLCDSSSQTGVLIGESTNAPFSVVWTNPPVGPYTLTAKAVDNSDAISSSPTIAITVGRPSNDNFANRLQLSGGSVNAFGTTLATGVESGEPAIQGHTNSHSVWWSWTAPATGSNLVMATMANTRPFVTVFRGNTLATLIPVSDLISLEATFTNGDYYYATEAPFTSVAGTTYSILVDSGTGPVGAIDLKIVSFGGVLQIGSWNISNGLVVMQLAGNDGRRVIIETSSDLRNWQPLTTNIIVGGAVTFSDSSQTTFPHRFYRAVLDSTGLPFTINNWGVERGRFALSTIDTDGAEIQIEASTNLQSWVPIAINSTSGGVFTYSDVISTNSRNRFYRALRRQ